MLNYYKQAPTFLFNLDGETRLFNTQKEVDAAWEDGWFGPPWLIQDVPLLSTKEWKTKAKMIREVADDPRYEGLVLIKGKKMSTLLADLQIFELENGVETYAEK